LEALYADLGHFGRGPIRLSWLGLAFPALVFNYLGQGATLLSDPSKITDPFFYTVPTPLYWPMFVLAILATAIASQAMNSGAFSILSQAVNLNYFPTVTVRHTSPKVYGQVYIPEINFLLLGLCIIIVVAFQQSERIGSAYGLTVCTDMIFTTFLYSCQLRFYRKYPWPLVIAFFLISFHTMEFSSLQIRSKL
jgi:KUP system potassium uptake protein